MSKSFTVESICNAGGLGFNGFTKDGHENWDLMQMVDIVTIEYAESTRSVMLAWNIATRTWLRRLDS